MLGLSIWRWLPDCPVQSISGFAQALPVKTVIAGVWLAGNCTASLLQPMLGWGGGIPLHE
jgi:hypothetical protein